MRRQRGRGWLVILILLALAAAGAWYHFRPQITQITLPLGATPIREIVAAPARFEGKEVTVNGVVTGTSDIRLSGGTATRTYTLNDSGAELIVVAQGQLPGRGQALAVTGAIARPPPGHALAPRLAETKRERAGQK